MSLNYEFKNGRPAMDDAAVFSVCMSMMSAGINEITEESLPVLVKRTNMFCAMNCCTPPPEQKFKDCMGLWTNVHPEGKTEWFRRISKYAGIDLPKRKYT